MATELLEQHRHTADLAPEERAFIDTIRSDEATHHDFTLPGATILRNQRFSELLRRIDNSRTLIQGFQEKGKTHLQSNEERFVRGYEAEILALRGVASVYKQELQVIEQPSAKEEFQSLVIDESGTWVLTGESVSDEGANMQHYSYMRSAPKGFEQ